MRASSVRYSWPFLIFLASCGGGGGGSDSAGTAPLPPATFYPNGAQMSVGPTSQTYGHGGALPGTAASLFRDANGYSMVILMNTQGGPEPLYFDVVSVMTQALGTAFQGSASDLYPQYPSPSLPASEP